MADNSDQFADAEEEKDLIEISDSISNESKKYAESSAKNNKKRPAEELPTSSLPVLAKARLSKWAARLFDPNRIKGLVEPPIEIPLNDEFLSAFGKKEKQLDANKGVCLEVETAIADEDEGEDAGNTTCTAKSKATTTPSATRKVKIQNIKYTTTAATLEHVCGTFGPIENANLLMDPNVDNRNTGLAYVTFVAADAATDCCKKLQYIDGRDVRVVIASQTSTNGRTPGASNSGGGSRYWRAEDLATKCFKCGQTGHRAADCPNQPKAKPCCLCASTGHDVRTCPMRVVCFQCGVPGHAIKDCKASKRTPRIVCTNCFQTNHHRSQCRASCSPADVADAICATCGQLGHFSCKKPTFFYGLLDRFCSNCGRPGHWVEQCRRPRVEECSRQPHLLDAELNEAARDRDVIEYVMANVQRHQEQQQQQRNHRNKKGQRPPQQHNNKRRSK